MAKLERIDDWNPIKVLFRFWKTRAELQIIDLYLRSPEAITTPLETERHSWLPSMGRRKGSMTDG